MPWQAAQPLPTETCRTPSMCLPPATSMEPSGRTVAGWQPLQKVSCRWGAGGGKPWQVEQTPGRPGSGSAAKVQVGPWDGGDLMVAPWQCTPEQVGPARFQDGVAPREAATVPKVTSAGGGPRCPGESTAAGTRWHSPQGTAARTGVSRRWSWWAPTATSVVAEPPESATGGAAFVGPPWQWLQPLDGFDWAEGRASPQAASRAAAPAARARPVHLMHTPSVPTLRHRRRPAGLDRGQGRGGQASGRRPGV